MSAHMLERSSRAGARRTERGALSLLRHVDVLLLASTLAISALGIVVVYAATRNTFVFEPTYYVKRQVLFSIIGVIVMVTLICIDYRRLEQWAYVLLGALVLSLLAVLAVGKSVGAGSGGTTSGVSQRWINLGPFQFQPSEFAVLGVIVALALYMSRHQGDLGFMRLVPMLALAGAPLLLIVLQPDLGTAIVMVVVLFTLLYAGGVRLRYLLLLLLLGAAAFFVAIDLHFVKSFEIQRLTSFLHPNANVQGVGYQEFYAQQAIGQGGLRGTGLFRGIFTQLNYVPEQSTDFIFATVGEQLGFVGSTVVVGLYAVMALRVLRAVQAARDPLGRLLCAGVLAFLVFSAFQNIGMNIGLMPITGIPLPFVSYGGSAIIVFYAAIGLVLNVEMRRYRNR